MHFADLTTCSYHTGPFDAGNWAVPLRAIGWLEGTHPFATGEVPPLWLSRLRTLIDQSRDEYRQFGFRGIHTCSLCAAGSRTSPSEPGWSQENLFVPGVDAVYLCPSGILHYIEDHSYLPPTEFLEAVQRCPDVDSVEYRQVLKQANADVPPPLNETWSECLAKSRAFAKAVTANGKLQ